MFEGTVQNFKIKFVNIFLANIKPTSSHSNNLLCLVILILMLATFGSTPDSSRVDNAS